MADEDPPPLSALERYVLDTLHAMGKQQVTITELAERARLPHGAVRMSLQWLLSCNLVQCDEDFTHFRAA